MKTITMYELLGMIKEGKASDITTNFMFDGEKYNLLGFLDKYTLDINALNWRIEILEGEKKIPEKLEEYIHTDSLNYNQCNYMFEKLTNKYNEIIDYLEYLKSKGDE